MKYPKKKIEARKLFVQDGKSPAEICELLGGSPAVSTVRNWVRMENWRVERDKHQQMMYEKLSPSAMEEKIFQKLERALEETDINKSADSMIKVARTIREVLDPTKNIPVIYQTLTEFISYCKKYHPNLVTDDFLNASRDFKNYKIGQIEDTR